MKDTKIIYEQLGGTYREEKGNLIPDMELPEQKSIGKYGRMHLDYLKQHRRGRYSTLLGEGQLNAYLTDVDEHAQEMLTSMTVELAKSQGIDEHLKETDQIRCSRLVSRSAMESRLSWSFLPLHTPSSILNLPSLRYTCSGMSE